jgi:hypothetical protein
VLTPGDEIRNLLGRYTELVDAGDWDGVGELFARGRLATDDGTVLAEGADAVAAFYRSGTRLHDGSPRTKHLVANPVLHFEAEDRAVVTSSYVVFQAVGGGPLQPIIAGRYTDRFAASPVAPSPGAEGAEGGGGGWHFTERRFAVDLVGDLANHLTWEL